jgi:hypothetical protein
MRANTVIAVVAMRETVKVILARKLMPQYSRVERTFASLDQVITVVNSENPGVTTTIGFLG